MNSGTLTQHPLRVGIFDSVVDADVAVRELLAAGFTNDQITVICSEESIRRHFHEFEHQDPAGMHTPTAAITGGACGATIGGLAAIALASSVSLGGVALIAIGGLALWCGGVLGGLVGAMMTRGVEKELANFYDQAVEQGRILVAAEELDPTRRSHLDRAGEIFARHGIVPIPLDEG